MKTILKFATLLGGIASFAPRAALAEGAQNPFGYEWTDDSVRSSIGVSTVLGGGITGFTDKTMRDTVSSNVGGLWDLRVTIGSHTPLAFEAGYVGTAANIDALTGTQNGTLVGTAFEGALRFNALPHYTWTPYAFAGLGWQRYDITGADFKLSSTGMNESDNALVIPMGAGVSYRNPNGFVLDLRGTFRAVADADLVLENADSNSYTSMHTWEAKAAAGYEF